MRREIVVVLVIVGVLLIAGVSLWILAYPPAFEEIAAYHERLRADPDVFPPVEEFVLDGWRITGPVAVPGLYLIQPETFPTHFHAAISDWLGIDTRGLWEELP